MSIHEPQWELLGIFQRGARQRSKQNCPFSGVAPQLYKRAFMKDRDLKKKDLEQRKAGSFLSRQVWFA
jgi:hypothetical protein